MITPPRCCRAGLIGLLLACHGACSSHTPSPSQAPDLSHDASLDASVPPQPQRDAAPSADAAPPAHSTDPNGQATEAGQPPGEARPARVLMPGRGLVERAREDGCKENHAACHPGTCFRTSLQSERPATPPAFLRCEHDVDCTGSMTRCAGREGVDARAVRADAIGPWKERLCGAPTPPDPGDSSLPVACVEGACRLVVPLEPAWCEPSPRTYVITDGNDVIKRPVREDCAGYTHFCPSPGSCYSAVRPTPERPSMDMARCQDDSECVAASIDCCDCGPYRAIRRDAEARWRSVHQCTQVNVCGSLARVCGYFGQTACVAGRCELLEAASGPQCTVAGIVYRSGG